MAFGDVVNDAGRGFAYGLNAGSGYLSFIGNAVQNARYAGQAIRGQYPSQQDDLAYSYQESFPYTSPQLYQDNSKDLLGLLAVGLVLFALLK